MGILDGYYGKGSAGTSSSEPTEKEFDPTRYSRLKPLSYYAPAEPTQAERPNAPGLMSDVRRASGQFVSGVGSTLRDLGAEDVGGAVEQYGAGVVQRNPSEIRSFDDVLSRPFTTAREAVGEVVPQVGLALGSRALGALGGGLIAGPPGALVGGFLGGLLPTAAQTYGGIRTEQRAEGIDERGRALAVTIPAALLERFGGAERVALRVAGEGTEFLRRAAGTGFTRNAAQQFARGGVEELITEIPQTALERYGVTGETADLTSPEAFDEYGVAGAKGFLGGGTVRAGLSSLAGTRPTVTVQPDGTITSDQPVTGAEGETDLTGGSNVLMTPEQAAQRLQQIQARRPAALGDEAFTSMAEIDLAQSAGRPVTGELTDMQRLTLAGPNAPRPVTGGAAGLTPMQREALLGPQIPGMTPMRQAALEGPTGIPQPITGGAAALTPLQQQALRGPQTSPRPVSGELTPAQQAALAGPDLPRPVTGELSPAQQAALAGPNVPRPVTGELTPAQQAAIAGPDISQSALPTVPAGVTLTADENRIVKQASAIFSIAETDAERASVVAMVQRTIDRAVQRSPAPVTPVGAPTAVAAALPAAQPAAGVSSTATTGDQLGTQAPETQQAEAQGQKPAAVRIASTQTAEQQAADELGLTAALQTANRTKATGNPLQASVEGAGKVAVPGKASLSVKSLRDIRDALLNPSATVEGIGAKEQAIADAVRAFAKAYYKLSNAGGNMLRGIPSERAIKGEGGERIYKPTKFAGQTPAQQRGQIKAKTGTRVENTMKLLEETRAALAALGKAVNGNAKDVEAIVKLTKDMVQQKLHTQVNDTGINEDFGQKTTEREDGKDPTDIAFGKLDTMLSQGWNAAKANMFQGTSDAMFVRQTAIRESKEATAAGESQTPLEKAAEGYAVFGKGESSDGILGVMNYIQTHGTPFERTIAKAVFESMAYQNPPKLVFITEGNPRFDPKKNTIYIQRDASAAVTLHEALHSALQWYVYGNPEAAEVRALKASLKQVVNFKGPLGADAKRVQDLLKALMKDKKELDAVLELVSYGNTLNDFRRALEAMDSTEAPKSFFDAANNVWQSILTAVQKMLGIKPSVASDVIANTFKLLEAAGQKGQKKGKVTGSVLEAAIQSTDPTTAPTIDAAAQQVGFADATAFANGPGKFKTPTQLVFELVGLGRVNGKDLPLTASIAKNGAKLANYIRKEVPTLERVIMQFNSNFSNSPATVAAIDNYKFLAQTGHLQMEKIATTIAARPELREPFLDYMDGNTKAFAGIENASGFKAIADNLKGLMQQYISTLPANSKERRAFESMPFTQYIISPTSISQVAGSTLSAGKIASMVGTKEQAHQSLDEFKQFLDMTDGTVDQDQPLYQMFEEKLGKTLPVGFISKAQYDKTGVTPAGFSVDAKRVWKFSKYDTDKGDFRFSSSITTRDALKNLNSEDLALALVNTTAALSHAHAATTYFGNLASLGREGGKPTAEAIAFDSVEEINEVFGDRKLELNNVLQVSDEASKSQSLRWQTQRTGTWVQLPQGTTYGALAG